MLKLYKFEMKKIHRGALLWILIIIFTFLTCATSWMEASAFNDYEGILKNIQIDSEDVQKEKMSDMTAAEKEEYQKYIGWETMLRDGATQEQIEKMSEEEKIAYNAIRSGKTIDTFDVKEANRLIENDINTSFGIPSFINNALDHTNVLKIVPYVLVLVVLISAIISKEYSESTIKMSLLSPHRRSEIIGAKIAAIFTIIIEITAIAAFFSALTGVAFFLIKGVDNPEPFNCLKEIIKNGEYATVNVSVKLLGDCMLSLLESFLIASFVIILAVISRNMIATILVPTILYLIPEMVTNDAVKANPAWLYSFFNLKGLYILSSTTSLSKANITVSILVSFVWLLLFLGGSIFIFNKQDVYN